MKTCINWRIVGALALVALAVLAVAPNLLGAALPLLVLAACPLSMLVMMRAMQGGGRCESRSGATAGDSRFEPADSSAESARLRTEIDQLRTQRAEGKTAQETRNPVNG